MNIYIAGHGGMVGSAIVRQLKADPVNKIIQRTHAELDLTNQAAVNKFIEGEKIDQIYLAAAKVGGINANHTYPADFIHQNLMIQSNIMNLCEIEPSNAYRWFMEHYMDSSEWVMYPNVYGMGLFSDGGVFQQNLIFVAHHILEK